MRSYSFPENLTQWVQSQLVQLDYSLEDTKKLADAVLKLSDHFVSKRGPTPWDQKWAQAAYLSYYFPIGYVRGLAVKNQIPKPLFNQFAAIFEMGSGAGNVSAALWGAGQKWSCLELSRYAKERHRELFQSQFTTSLEFLNEFPFKRSFDLGVFSFVLNELSVLPDFDSFKTVVIMEPATHQDFARFLQIRTSLLKSGFHILAPCPHQQQCPLAGGRDWCHDRVRFEFPEWFHKLETQLPIKNQTVTYSYLIATKVKEMIQAVAPQETRLIGDMLHENGKSRIMVCRGAEREFLSWLHKAGPVPTLYRGENYALPSTYEKKGNEIRIK